MQKSFQMRLLKKVPGDLQLLVCATGIQLTMGEPYQKEFLKNLGMVVLFPKEFITPDINTQLHHVEVNRDVFDCLLLSIDYFSKGLKNPQNYYNSGIHGMAKILKLERGIHDHDIPYDGDPKELLVHLHHRDFKIVITLYTGLGQMEVFEMATNIFLLAPIRLKNNSQCL